MSYSATVEIWLAVGNLHLAVSQIGDTSLILAAPFSENPVRLLQLKDAVATVTIDGEPTEYPIEIRGVTGRLVEFQHKAQESSHARLAR